MTEQERIHHLKIIGAKGGKSRAKAFTSQYQKDARAQVSSQVCAKNGAKGCAALVSAGKADLASRIVADYRFNHPTKLARQWLFPN